MRQTNETLIQKLEVQPHLPRLAVGLARCEADIEAAQRLRYKVFAEEMGANISSHDGLDVDHYDEFCQHLIVRDVDASRVVGCYRLLAAPAARAANGWYSANEFDLGRIKHLLPNTVELGRACVHRDYRHGGTIMLLWSGIVKFMQAQKLEYMMGCASVGMADGGHFAASLYQRLASKHLCPPEYRVFPRLPLPLQALRHDVPAECPALIKGYLRAGSYICGEPAWDAQFNCADMLLLMPLSRLNTRYLKHFVQ